MPNIGVNIWSHLTNKCKQELLSGAFGSAFPPGNPWKKPKESPVYPSIFTQIKQICSTIVCALLRKNHMLSGILNLSLLRACNNNRETQKPKLGDRDPKFQHWLLGPCAFNTFIVYSTFGKLSNQISDYSSRSSKYSLSPITKHFYIHKYPHCWFL